MTKEKRAQRIRETNENNGIGEAIKELRECLGMSMYRMAKEIEIRDDLLSMLEKGSHHPRIETLYRMGALAKKHHIRWLINFGA